MLLSALLWLSLISMEKVKRQILEMQQIIHSMSCDVEIAGKADLYIAMNSVEISLFTLQQTAERYERDLRNTKGPNG